MGVISRQNIAQNNGATDQHYFSQARPEDEQKQDITRLTACNRDLIAG
jgi:hypothetical protein